MECKYVAFTIPEKPTSGKQEYKLTKKGVDLVESVVSTVDEFYKEQGWIK